jgi:hypothetical protein
MTLNRVLPIALLTTIPLFVCAPNLRAVSADCIDLQSEDMRGSGNALVANERFLAIDDAQASRVDVYRSFLAKNYLFTVENQNSNNVICIAPSSDTNPTVLSRYTVGKQRRARAAF